jgi:DUF1009 family protein
VSRLGLIAGGGRLPLELAEACKAAGRPVFVIRLKGITDPDMAAFEGADVGLAELGAMLGALKKAGCDSVCLAGRVQRPDFSKLKPDLRALKSLPAVIAAAKQGDDALLRVLLTEFEKEGFRVKGAHEVSAGLTLGEGPLGSVRPTAAQLADAELAASTARAIGRLDIGQGAVVCDGLVLAVEAQEGTDAMLERCAGLPSDIRGSRAAPRGALAKMPKPVQDRRIDLPVMGVATLERAAAAGLTGVVGEAGGLLLVEREAVRQAADRLGLFVLGLPKATP